MLCLKTPSEDVFVLRVSSDTQYVQLVIPRPAQGVMAVGADHAFAALRRAFTAGAQGQQWEKRRVKMGCSSRNPDWSSLAQVQLS